MADLNYVKKTYQDEIDRLEAINSLQLTKINTLEQLVTKYESERRIQMSLSNKEKQLKLREDMLAERQKTMDSTILAARRYRALVNVIDKYEPLQSEWVSLMTLIKLICDQADIKDLY